MKNIVVLDAHTLSPLQPGEHSPFHPSWDTLAALGPLQLYPRTKSDEVVARAQNAQILLTNKAVVSADHINALPQLEYIGVMATGYNVVDLDAARARGIPVTNIPGYGTASVAQHVFALLLELTARVGATDAAVKNGDWARCPDFCFTVSPFVELAGKTLGIVGYGTIGQAVARIAAAFGMRILATARSPKPSEVPVEWVSREELFRQSDVITLHCPLTEDTRHLINAESLAAMKPSAFLINTGRGPLIDEAALATALKDGVIAGFGGDVLSAEPPSPTNPLLAAPRTVITPHIAWASVEARTRLMGILAKNILDFLAGTPSNIVNGVTAGAGTTLASPEEHAPPSPEPQEVPSEEAAAEESVTIISESAGPAVPVDPDTAEPTVPETPQDIPENEAQGALAETLAAADSTTPESTPETAAPEEFSTSQPFAPEAVPADSLPRESTHIANDVTPDPLPASLEPLADSTPPEALAETLAAVDSTTPETTPEVAALEETQPSSPETDSVDSLPNADGKTAAPEPALEDSGLQTPVSPEESYAETVEEQKTAPPPHNW